MTPGDRASPWVLLTGRWEESHGTPCAPPDTPLCATGNTVPATGTRTGTAPRGQRITAAFLLRLPGWPSRGCEELLEAWVWGTRQGTWNSGSLLPSHCLSMFMPGLDLPQAWGQPPSPDPQPGRHAEPLWTRTSQTHTLTGARTRVHTKMHMPRHTCVLTRVYARMHACPPPPCGLAGWAPEQGLAHGDGPEHTWELQPLPCLHYRLLLIPLAVNCRVGSVEGRRVSSSRQLLRRRSRKRKLCAFSSPDGGLRTAFTTGESLGPPGRACPPEQHASRWGRPHSQAAPLGGSGCLHGGPQAAGGPPRLPRAQPKSTRRQPAAPRPPPPSLETCTQRLCVLAPAESAWHTRPEARWQRDAPPEAPSP